MKTTESESKDLKKAKDAFKGLGVTIKFDKDTEEFVVNLKDGKEDTAYYTDDIEDAIKTGKSMAKKESIDVIEIQEEIVIEQGDKKVILEKGDKIKVLKEKIFIPTSTDDLLNSVDKSLKNFREPSGFPYSVREESETFVKELIFDIIDNRNYEDFSDGDSFEVEINISKEMISINLDEGYYYDLGINKLVDWLLEQKYRTISWVDDVIENINSFDETPENFEELVNLARKLAIESASEDIIRHLENEIEGIYWED